MYYILQTLWFYIQYLMQSRSQNNKCNCFQTSRFLVLYNFIFGLERRSNVRILFFVTSSKILEIKEFWKSCGSSAAEHLPLAEGPGSNPGRGELFHIEFFFSEIFFKFLTKCTYYGRKLKLLLLASDFSSDIELALSHVRRNLVISLASQFLDPAWFHYRLSRSSQGLPQN